MSLYLYNILRPKVIVKFVVAQHLPVRATTCGFDFLLYDDIAIIFIIYLYIIINVSNKSPCFLISIRVRDKRHM